VSGDTRLSASYHVLVIGSDLGGLMYAALAARAGYRVGVIAHGMKPNTYRSQGHAFTRCPERFYGFGTSPTIAKVFGDLSLGMEMRNRPQAVEPFLQFVTPSLRLDLPRRSDRWRQEIDRELGEVGSTLLAYERWAEQWSTATESILATGGPLPPTGLRAARQYAQAIEGCEPLLTDESGHGHNPLMTRRGGATCRALIDGTLRHLVTVQPRPLSPMTFARLWTHLRDGVYHIPGGRDGLKELFIAKLREQCGDFRRSAIVEQVVVRRGRATEVILAGRGERLGCDLLIGNLPHQQLNNLIPAPQRKAPSGGEQEPVAWRMMVNVGVDPRVIPAGMGPEVVCIDEPMAGHAPGPSLWISRPGALGLGGDGRQGAGVLSVSVNQTARGLAPGVRAVEQTVEATLDRLRWLIPWLDDHLQVVDVPALTRKTDRRGEETLAVDMSEMTPIYGRPLPMTADMGGVAIQTPYRNVLLCEEAIFGGLGFEGLCLGALQTLAATRRQLKLKTLRPNLA
jgi:phytoene dehydrogenase-like protein